MLGAVSAIVLLCSFTPSQGIFAAMRWARLPRVFVEIAALMYRYIFLLFEQAAGVVAAQKVRLGYARFSRALGAMGRLGGIVMLRAIEQADRTHEAMLARGYRGSLQVAPLPPLGRRDRLAIAACVAGVALAFLAAERWPA